MDILSADQLMDDTVFRYTDTYNNNFQFFEKRCLWWNCNANKTDIGCLQTAVYFKRYFKNSR